MTLKETSMGIAVFMMAVLFISCKQPPSKTEEFKASKEPRIENVKHGKPVKVELQRLKDGTYTWQIKGDDVEEIIKADTKLRKKLGVE
jgi:hypothetical protein